MSSQQKVPFVPWVLVLVLVMSLFIGAYFFNLWPSQRVKTMELRAPEGTLLEKRENNDTVNDYIRYVLEDREKMSLGHDFSNQALLKLSAAISAMAKAIGYKLTTDLLAADDYANQIKINPTALTHADDIIKSAGILTEALISMQKKKYPSLAKEAEKLRNSANDIDAHVLTLNQRKKVKTFFIDAAELLKKMN